MTVGIGLIGAGYMGRTYAACLANGMVPAGRLVGIWGGKRAPELAAEFGSDAEPTLEALIARADVDAVLITSPHSAHLPQTRAAAAAGKHVYTEKPMALNLSECDGMIGACRDAGVKLAVNKVLRFRHAPMAAKRLIDNGAIGEIRMIQARGSWTGFFLNDIIDEATGRVIIPVKRWAFDPLEGSQFLDWGVHCADVMRWLTSSEPVRVFARYTTYGTPPPADMSALAQVEFASGAMAHVVMTYELPEPGILPADWMMIVGSKGLIDLDLYGRVKLGRGSGWELVDEQPAFNFLGDYLDPNRLKGFAAQTQDFCEAIRDGREPAVTGADGRAAVEVVMAADRSAATAQAVTLPLSPA